MADLIDKFRNQIAPNIFDFGFDMNFSRRPVQSQPEDIDNKDSVRYNEVEGQVEAQRIRFGSLNVGAGSKRFSVDPTLGQWMGAEKFADAPFSVDMDGNLIASSATIAGYRVYEALVASDGTGDYTSIQAALDDGKKDILVKRGLYSLSSPITITTGNVTITGDSRGRAIVVASTAFNDNMVEIGNGVDTLSNITISNITFNGSRSTQTSGVNHIFYCQKTINDLTIQNCLIGNVYGGNIIFLDGGTLGDFAGGRILNNYFLTTDGTPAAGEGVGIKMDGAYQYLVSGNDFTQCYGNAITILDPSTLITVSGNFISVCGIGVSSDADTVSIIDNKINDCRYDGINVTGDWNVISGNQLGSNNTSPATISAEISVVNLTTVTGNSIAQGFSPGSTFGIYVNGQTSTVTGNTLYDATGGFTSVLFSASSTASIGVANASQGYTTGVTDSSGGNTLANNVDS